MKKLINSLRKIHIRRSISAFIFSLIAFATYSFPIITVIIVLISILLAILGFNKKKWLSILAIIISLLAVIFSIYKYKTRVIPLADPNAGNNVLVGIWQSDQLTYEFKSDKTYKQYVENTDSENYCTGTYGYEYSYTTNDGKIITKDYDYTYYYVVLKPSNCVIEGIPDVGNDVKQEKSMVFGYGNHNKNNAVMVNNTTNNYLLLHKK